MYAGGTEAGQSRRLVVVAASWSVVVQYCNDVVQLSILRTVSIRESLLLGKYLG